MTGRSTPAPGRRDRRSHPDRHHAVHPGRAPPGPRGGVQPLVRAGPLLRRVPDRRLQLRRRPVRVHRPAQGAALPGGRRLPWWPTRRSAATSASTTCSTATTTSGTGGPSTRSTRSTPPAGCSTSATTSTPASTASSGSTAATTTGCRPSSPSTTGSRGWCRCSSSRPRELTPEQIGAWYRDEYLPVGAARIGGGHRAGLQPAAPAGRRPRRRAPLRVGGPAGAVCCGSSTTIPPARGRRSSPPRPRRWPASGLGRVQWASPFIGTVPGTDTYTDQLWSAPA